VTVSGAGFPLNNEMDDFTVKLGAPNYFGLVQGAANQIGPRRRMLSSMAPTLVLDRAGRPFMIVGARGGSRIITAVWEILSSVIDHDLDVGAAVYAPRFHHQHLPDTVFHEPNALTPAQIEALRARGHTLAPFKSSPSSVVNAILRRDGVWTGAGDPRRGGVAKGL
jgi:gamma-glutamyltranspeptidase/glutathione hydrolase